LAKSCYTIQDKKRSSGEAVKNKFKKATFLGLLENIVWPILIFVYLTFALLKPDGMLSWEMTVEIVYAAIPLGFLVMAEALVLLNGNFDLSVEQIAGISAAIGGVYCSTGIEPLILTPLVPIAVGFLCGCINGFFVGKMGLNAFLVTLGTFFAFDGIQMLVSSKVIYEFPTYYLIPGGSRAVSICIFVSALAIFQFWLHRTKLGYYYLAVGSTPRAAEMMGLSLPRFKFYAFVLSGTLSGIAGLFYTGYTGAYGPMLAEGAVFMAFAGAVLGGISLKGGRGKIFNVFGGVILLGTISSGLTVLATSPYVRRILFGGLVVAAIIIDLLRNRVRESVMREE
jgi:ribose/xylose/arabinose/galactoside ABC-type transport system permease subunit